MNAVPIFNAHKNKSRVEKFLKYLSAEKTKFELFGIDEDFLNNSILREIVFEEISFQANTKNPDYFLNFIIDKRQFCSMNHFNRFLFGNYEPERASEELLKAFRRASWINGRDGGFKMTQIFKSFLSYDLRASFLRKILGVRAAIKVSEVSTIFEPLSQVSRNWNSLLGHT